MAAVDFLASRGMGEPGSSRGRPRGVESPGEESRSLRHCGTGDRGAAVLRPDQAMERPCGPRAEQHPREKTWRTSIALHKRSGFPGEDKKPRRSDGMPPESDQSVRTAAPPRERLSVGVEALASLSVTGTDTFPVTRTSVHRTDLCQPIDDEAQAHPSLVAAANRSDAGPAKTTGSRFGVANASCARRPRGRQEQPRRPQRPRASLRTARRYARVQASCGCSDGRRHGKDETDRADGPRADRYEVDLANRKGRPAG